MKTHRKFPRPAFDRSKDTATGRPARLSLKDVKPGVVYVLRHEDGRIAHATFSRDPTVWRLTRKNRQGERGWAPQEVEYFKEFQP